MDCKLMYENVGSVGISIWTLSDMLGKHMYRWNMLINNPCDSLLLVHKHLSTRMYFENCHEEVCHRLINT
jgi:hypothetical protein